MDNPFFKNNGPYKLRNILKDLNVENLDNYLDHYIIDIKDLQNSKLNEITFFHSKKYKEIANYTKASFCITTKNLQNELPKSCIPIIVDNVLLSTSLVTAKFYPDSINDDFDITVEEINKTKFNDKVLFGKNVLLGKNVSIGSNCKIGHNTIIEKNVSIGDNCIIAGQVGFAGSSTLGNNVMIGGQAGVSGHLKVGSNVQIGGGSGVIKDIPDNTKVMGYPAKNLREFIKDNR